MLLCWSTVKGTPSRALEHTTQRKQPGWYAFPSACRIWEQTREGVKCCPQISGLDGTPYKMDFLFKELFLNLIWWNYILNLHQFALKRRPNEHKTCTSLSCSLIFILQNKTCLQSHWLLIRGTTVMPTEHIHIIPAALWGKCKSSLNATLSSIIPIKLPSLRGTHRFL